MNWLVLIPKAVGDEPPKKELSSDAELRNST